jgi:hypothetical protein
MQNCGGYQTQATGLETKWYLDLNALLIIGILICQALIVQGDLGVKERVSPVEDWWASRGLTHNAQMKEQEM